MADTPLQAPTNKLVEVINIILDHLITGLGADLAFGAATAAVPWLAWPIISQLLRACIDGLAYVLDKNGKAFADKLVIRFQNDLRKGEYDNAIEQIKKPGATPDEIQKAKDAMDRLINRNK